MSQLKGKKIILGITGSIAAYKAASLVRLWVKAGAEVQVLMTEAATGFIAPLTLSTLSRRPVLKDIHTADGWNNHVELGLWADAMVIAPATATTLAKLSLGIADNVLAAVYLSARCPVFFAPAMDLDMWRHPAVQGHVERLRSFGNHLIPVGVGELASGLVGEGRMAEPEEITSLLERFFGQKKDFAGKTLLITAGPTYEPLDPVRFIGNRSSGRMGVALADAAARRGACVHLVLGPSRLTPSDSGVTVYRVETAQQMYDVAMELFPQADAAILSAAVADYRPAAAASEKIKKTGEEMMLRLVKNPDIAATMGNAKKAGQLLIGFALETENGEANAREKLHRKRMDAIVLNSLRDTGAGFDTPTNRVAILTPDNNTIRFELKQKEEVAEDILNALAGMWTAQT